VHLSPKPWLWALFTAHPLWFLWRSRALPVRVVGALKNLWEPFGWPGALPVTFRLNFGIFLVTENKSGHQPPFARWKVYWRGFHRPIQAFAETKKPSEEGFLAFQ
jgi:hypothetical protein